jgi:hypothetical protein
MWRNDCTLHRVTDYDIPRSRRVMHGTTLLGTQSVVPAGCQDSGPAWTNSILGS